MKLSTTVVVVSSLAIFSSFVQAKTIKIVSRDLFGGQAFQLQVDAPNAATISNGYVGRLEFGNATLDFDTWLEGTSSKPQFSGVKNVYVVRKGNLWAEVYKDEDDLYHFGAFVPSNIEKGRYITCTHRSSPFKRLKSETELNEALKVCQSAKILKKAQNTIKRVSPF
jgi:hypothetical protein